MWTECQSCHRFSRRQRKCHRSLSKLFLYAYTLSPYIYQCVSFSVGVLLLTTFILSQIPSCFLFSLMDNHSSHADKGVQTDSTTCSRDSSPVRTFHAFPQINSPSDLQALDVSQSSGLSSALRSLGHLGAYTYSDASLDDSRYISDRPVLNSGRTAKYGQLGYNKPRHGLPTNHRIASLPETSPPYRIAQENTVRLVSMPEHLQMLHHSGALSVEYLDYSECMNISSASDSKSNFRNSPANCTLLAPVPRTPSPPSSPESVMIIGNDNHVPPAFLRPKSSIDDDDHGGTLRSHSNNNTCLYAADRMDSLERIPSKTHPSLTRSPLAPVCQVSFVSYLCSAISRTLRLIFFSPVVRRGSSSKART